MYVRLALYLAARINVDILTLDTVRTVLTADRDVKMTVDSKVEADVRLVLCPSDLDLDLDVLLGEQDGDIRNVLVEHDARTAAMQSRGELTTMATHGGRGRIQEPESRFDVCTQGTSTSPVNGTGRRLENIKLEGLTAQALSGFSSGGGGSGRGDRGRNDEYDNNKDNNEDIIHVRRKFVNVGGIGKGLGTTGSDRRQQLPGNKDKYKDDRPSPPPPFRRGIYRGYGSGLLVLALQSLCAHTMGIYLSPDMV